MATAAPAAPSPSATPAAPAAPAAGGASQPAPGASPEAAPTPTAAKPAKPAPRPIPRLPGVIPDDDTPFPSAPSPEARTAGDRARDAAGRFLPADPTAADPVEGDHTPEPATEAKPAKYKFAGEEFDSQELAEQNFKSLRGQFKPLQQKAAVAEKAAESARGWHAEAQRISAENQSLRAELEQLRSGKQPAAGTAPTPATPGADPAAAEVQGIDWDMYAEIARIANANGEGWKAQQWLQEQQERIISERVERTLQEALEPFQSQAEKAQTAEHIQNLFGNLATYTDSAGNPAFPELQNEAEATAVGRMWASLGLPRQAALSPQGVIAAIAMYRMSKSMSSQGKPDAAAPTTPPPASAPAPAPEPAAVPTDTASAAALDDGRPSVARPGASAGNGQSAEAMAILQGLRNARAGTSQAARLGFEP